MISNMHGGNRSPRWRGVLIALVLALAFGSIGGVPLARAMPTSVETVSYSVFAYPTQFEIRNCPKAKQEIYVGVRRTVTKVIGGKSYDMTGGTVNDVNIEATMAEPKRGSISPSAASIISMDRTGTFQTAFIYDPEKVGKDTIAFRRAIDELLAPLVPDATVQVKVLPCKYKVNLILDSQLSDEGVSWSAIGLVEDAIIEAVTMMSFAGRQILSSMYLITRRQMVGACTSLTQRCLRWRSPANQMRRY
jgi:hypothetical protein